MPALSEYTNVYNTALVVLQQKGYQLWYDPAADRFHAEKDGWEFVAFSPTGLLGVADPRALPEAPGHAPAAVPPGLRALIRRHRRR